MNYREKYLKYKSKYLQLKSNMNLNQFGGDKPLINDIDDINLFTVQRMEEHLNPIYGLILCNTGKIPNNYYLHKSKFINTDESKLINNICKYDTGSIRPTNDIAEEIKPYDYGFYAGIKYIYKIYEGFIVINNNSGKIKFPKIKNQNDIKILTESRNKLNKYIPIGKDDIFYFHMLLFCLWWSANNDDGIKQYYNGINDVFTILNKYLGPDKQLPYCNRSLKKSNTDESFERIVFNIINEKFKIYNQEWAKNFCQNGDKTYPDCGETTARNLINLISFNGNEFSIDILNKFCAIPELIEYYTKFNNFNEQSSNEEIEFMNEKLNPRDAWSKLIINCGKKNVRFMKLCGTNDNQSNYGFELNARLSEDGKLSNFLQLIKNLLLKIEKFSDIETDLITNIEDMTTDGIGYIEIKHKVIGMIKIHCNPGHYHMEIYSNDDFNNINLDNISQQQQNQINILLKKNINESNYIDILFDSNLLVGKLNSNDTDIELKNKLFELSLTKKYDSDARRRIELNTDNSIDNILCIYVTYLKNNANNANNIVKMDEYTYLYSNFNYVKKIPNLTHLNCRIKDHRITSIDLSPLSSSNIKSIGNKFLYNCENLTSINLSPLSNIESIGNDFLFYCHNLTSINLSPLSNIKSIGDYFLSRCFRLENIDLSSLSNIKSIGNNFLYSCSGLKGINLSPLSNIESIGDYFLYSCSGLKGIDLSPLSNVKSIGNNFLSNCENLTKINFSSLSNIKSIGYYFLSECVNLKEIDLSPLSNIKSIGNNFLNSCYGLENIDLSPLKNIKSIGDYFLFNCISLTEIDLSPLSNIISFGDGFLHNCKSIKGINLSRLQNIKCFEFIANDFLSGCKSLIEIDLSQLQNVKSIGNNFLANCNSLIKIDSPQLQNVKSIGDNFLADCYSLEEIDLSSLSNIKSIGYYFLGGCKSLIEIDLSQLQNVKSIGNNFLANCNSLIKINLPQLQNVKSIGDNFLADCYSLEEIDLSSLSNIKSIGYYFLGGCNSLEKIDLSSLSNIKLIGDYFLAGCKITKQKAEAIRTQLPQDVSIGSYSIFDIDDDDDDDDYYDDYDDLYNR
jgi:hypothetical protein